MARGRKPRNHRKKWSEEDEQYLVDNYGTVSMAVLMRNLGRDEEAIKMKYRTLEGIMDMHIAGGMLSTQMIADAIGKSHRAVYGWIKNKGLPATQKHKGTHETRNHYRFFIKPEDFWKWAEKNKKLISFATFKRGVILPEPDWLEEEVKSAIIIKSGPWTKEEEEATWFWYKGGTKPREIAEMLDRTVRSVQHKLTKLKKEKTERVMA